VAVELKGDFEKLVSKYVTEANLKAHFQKSFRFYLEDPNIKLESISLTWKKRDTLSIITSPSKITLRTKKRQVFLIISVDHRIIE